MVKILLVDPDPDFQEALAYNFRRQGYETVVVANGREALLQIESDPPDVVVTAERIEPITGLELTKNLRERFGQNIAIIMYTTDSIQAAAFEAGVDRFFRKPASVDVLLTAIKDLLPSEKEQAPALT